MRTKIFTLFISVILLGLLYGLNLASAQDFDPQSEEVVINYYRNPQPDQIPAALENIAGSDFIKNSDTEVSAMTSYLFGRIAQVEPSLIPKYIDVFKKTTHEGRVFILMVFQIGGDARVVEFLKGIVNDKDYAAEKKDINNLLERGIPVKFDPMTNEVKAGVDLDFLWAEFFVTGQAAPIVRIIDVLAWKDRFRERLNDWMFSKHSPSEIRRLNKLLAEEVGFDVDLSNVRINFEGDMDNAFAMFLRNSGDAGRGSKPAIEIRKILRITDEDMMSMAVKGAAFWSLWSNSRTHPQVRDICRTEVLLRDDKARRELMMINEE